MNKQATLFGFTFEDVQGDEVEVQSTGGAVEIEFKQVDGGEVSAATVMYFNQEHLEAFQEIVKLLENLKQ